MEVVLGLLLVMSFSVSVTSVILLIETRLVDYKIFKREKHKFILIGIISLCIFLFLLLIHSYN